MRKPTYESKFTSKIMVIKKCHICDHVNEGHREMESCNKCNKGFLPLNYFSKVHVKTSDKFKNLFADSDELHPDDLIKGLYVLW